MYLYLLDFCQPVSDVVSRLSTTPERTASEEECICRRAFSVAGSLMPDYLRDPAVDRDTFCKHLLSSLFAVY